MTALPANLSLPTAAAPAAPSATDRRSRRVQVLLVVVFALSGMDLAITVGHMSTVGMFEDNPIAVLLVEATGSVASLGFFKALTVLAATSLLYRLRDSPQAEIGAWLAVGILLGVTVQWLRYAYALTDIDMTIFQEVAALDGGWVRIG